MKSVPVRKQVGAILWDGDQTFIVLERNPQRYDGWGFIKGGIEGQESDIDAVVREISEEVGITLLDTNHLYDLDYFTAHFHQRNKYIGLVRWYLVKIPMPHDMFLELDDEEWSQAEYLDKKKTLAKLTWQTEQSAFARALQLIKSESF